LKAPLCAAGKALVFAFILVASAPCADAAVLDLRTENSQGTINGAIFRQYTPGSSTGTGVIDSFLVIGAKGTEKGYNTNASKFQFNEKSGTEAIQLSQVPTWEIQGTLYRELLLDLNESSNTGDISLDALKLYVESADDLDDHPSEFSTPVYDLGSNWIHLDYNTASGGGGKGDMLAFIPSSAFGSDQTKYVYLYCELGANHETDNGFEEWAVGVGGTVFPEPAALSLLIVGALAVLVRRRRR